MSYQVLARKWRPRSFSSLVGQSHIQTTLSNALNSGRLHHAYLFTGTRGVGKTTIARILAKCLNCEKGISATACLECSTCLAIEQGHCPDVIEVDAASQTKVESTRELLSNVPYMPVQCRFKIYLIDEVHMLSKHSFNALLKTLEEPPAHVKFIFATTEPEKLPLTILSRCLQFNLRKIKSSDMVMALKKILQDENIPFEIEALERIAAHAQGSLRDALSTLDQAINFGTQEIKSNEMSELLGTLACAPLLNLIEHLTISQPSQLWPLLQTISEFNPDYAHVLSDLVHLFYQIQLLQLFPKEQEKILYAYDSENIEKLKSLSQKISKEDVQLYYQIALLGQRDLTLHKNLEIGFNMTILRMLSFKPAIIENFKETTSIPTPLESKIQTVTVLGETLVSHPETSTPTQVPTLKNAQDWKTILPHLKVSGMTLALATHCEFEKIEHHLLYLKLQKSQSAFNSPVQIKQLTEAVCDYLKQSIKIVVAIVETQNSIPTHGQEETNDPHLKELMKIFNTTS